MRQPEASPVALVFFFTTVETLLCNCGIKVDQPQPGTVDIGKKGYEGVTYTDN